MSKYQYLCPQCGHAFLEGTSFTHCPTCQVPLLMAAPARTADLRNLPDHLDIDALMRQALDAQQPDEDIDAALRRTIERTYPEASDGLGRLLSQQLDMWQRLQGGTRQQAAEQLAKSQSEMKMSVSGTPELQTRVTEFRMAGLETLSAEQRDQVMKQIKGAMAEGGPIEAIKIALPPTTVKTGCGSSVIAVLLLTLVGWAAAQSIVRDSQYPAHWWTPVPKKDAPAWEILPQEAGEGEVILSKRNELGLLSNFAATPFEFRGKKYASLEGFWQAMKYPEGPEDERAKWSDIEWRHTRDEVAAMTAWDAKRAGDQADAIMRKQRIDWVSFEGKRMEYRPGAPGEHYNLIVEATREKVRQNPEVEKVLLSTGDLVLRPDHQQGRNPPAAWRYYDILTEIRHELQQQGETDHETAPAH